MAIEMAKQIHCQFSYPDLRLSICSVSSECALLISLASRHLGRWTVSDPQWLVGHLSRKAAKHAEDGVLQFLDDLGIVDIYVFCDQVP